MMHLRKTPFAQFIFYISGMDFKRFKAFVTIIGYLCHRYQVPSKMKAVILLDQNINELGKVLGGLGKSLIGVALSYVRILHNISGKDFKSGYNHAFEGVTTNTNLVCLNDIKQGENFENYFGRTSDGFFVNPKHKSPFLIPQRYMPKLLFTSNYVMKRPDGFSSERRMIEVELNPYFGPKLTVREKFGHEFFEDWNNNQWHDFYLFIIFCISFYLKHGIVNPPRINLDERLLIIEVGIELIEFLDEKFKGKAKHHKKELFKEFITGGYTEARYKPTLRSFTVRLKKYLEYKGLIYRETPSNTKAFIEIITEEDSINFTTINDVDTNYRTIDTANKMTRMINAMKKHFEQEDNNVLALDFETTGLDVFTDDAISLALSFKPKTGYNIMLPVNPVKRNKLLKPLLPFLLDAEIIKVMHNAKFDLKFFEKLDIELTGEIYDTMIMDYLFDPTIKSHGLKQISMRHLNYQMIDFKQMTGDKLITEVDTESLTDYAVEDADITLQLFNLLIKKLK